MLMRVVVLMPTWLGDCVMATPALRALKAQVGEGEVVAAVRPGFEALLEGLDFVDGVVALPWGGRLGAVWQAAGVVRGLEADTAVLLSNSFRSALVARLAGVAKRVGYARDGRGFLLTDRLKVLREGGRRKAVSAVDYYMAAVERAAGGGSEGPTTGNRGLRGGLALGVLGEDVAEMEGVLRGFGVGDGERLMVVHPGSQKAEKRWPGGWFGGVAARSAARWGLRVVVTGVRGEAAAASAVVAGFEAARVASRRQRGGGLGAGNGGLGGGGEVVNLVGAGLSLGGMKALMARATLTVTNDTGPRHLSAALGTPVVAVFGPTAPAWTLIPFDQERQVVSPAEDGDIRAVTQEAVWAAVEDLMGDEGVDAVGGAGQEDG